METHSVDILIKKGELPPRQDSLDTSSLGFLETPTAKSYGTIHQGTLTRYSIRGRFMELNALLRIRRHQLFGQSVAVIFMVPFWPLAIPVLCLIAPLSVVARDRAKRILCSVAVLLGMVLSVALVIYLVPMMCIYADGTFQFQRVSRHEVGTILLSHGGLMIFFLWAWTSESTYTEVRNIKENVMKRWRETRIGEGTYVKLSPQQRLTLQNLGMADQGVCLPEWTRTVTDPEQKVTLPNLVDLLDCLPGWKAVLQFESGASHHTEHGLLDHHHDEYTEDGLNRLDDLMIDSNHQSTQWDLFFYQSLVKAVCAKLRFCAAYMWIPLEQTPVTSGVLLITVIIRAFMPYIWMRIALHEKAMTCLPLYGCFLYAIVVYIWIVAALSAVVIYNDNATQMCLVSSLIDAQQRGTYIDILAHRCTESESRRYLGILPHLDCRHLSNVLIFWRIREYLLLNQKDATFSAETLVKILMSALALLVALAVLSVVSGGDMGLYDALCRFLDLGMIAFVVARLLHAAMQMSNYRERQVGSIVELRHDLMIKVSRPLTAHPDNKDLHVTQEEFDEVQQLLSHLIDKIERTDDKPLTWMGIALTPGNLMFLAISVGMTIFGLIEQLISLGLMGNLFEGRYHGMRLMAVHFLHRFWSSLKHGF